MEARAAAGAVRVDQRVEFARRMVCVALTAYWSELQSKSAVDWPLREAPSGADGVALPETAQELASAIGTRAAGMDVMDAGYAVGLLYTGALPERLRAKLGAYYTPPALCERLLDMAADAGVDWQTARVLDPACGGGAFLAPVRLPAGGLVRAGELSLPAALPRPAQHPRRAAGRAPTRDAQLDRKQFLDGFRAPVTE